MTPRKAIYASKVLSS